MSDINVGTTNDSTTKFLQLREGLVCVGSSENTTYRFSLPENVTSTRVVDIGGTSFAQFDNPITVVMGDEWKAGNLSYHLKSRPSWIGFVDQNKVNNLEEYICVDDVCVGFK